MLGIIHRTVLGNGPKHFSKFIKRAEASHHPLGRVALNAHDRQLTSYRTGNYLEMVSHSILGAIDVYNLLPAYVVAADDVSAFQNRLQQLLKAAAMDRMPGWPTYLSNRHLMFRHPLRAFSGFNGPGRFVECNNMYDKGRCDDAHACIQGWIHFGND